MEKKIISSIIDDEEKVWKLKKKEMSGWLNASLKSTEKGMSFQLPCTCNLK